MKCTIERRIKVNNEENEKIEYLKKELERKGLKVKISVVLEEKENVKMLSSTKKIDEEKKKVMQKLQSGGSFFKKKGGGGEIEGLKYEKKEVIIKIEVEV